MTPEQFVLLQEENHARNSSAAAAVAASPSAAAAAAAELPPPKKRQRLDDEEEAEASGDDGLLVSYWSQSAGLALLTGTGTGTDFRIGALHTLPERANHCRGCEPVGVRVCGNPSSRNENTLSLTRAPTRTPVHRRVRCVLRPEAVSDVITETRRLFASGESRTWRFAPEGRGETDATDAAFVGVSSFARALSRADIDRDEGSARRVARLLDNVCDRFAGRAREAIQDALRTEDSSLGAAIRPALEQSTRSVLLDVLGPYMQLMAPPLCRPEEAPEGGGGGGGAAAAADVGARPVLRC